MVGGSVTQTYYPFRFVRAVKDRNTHSLQRKAEMKETRCLCPRCTIKTLYLPTELSACWAPAPLVKQSVQRLGPNNPINTTNLRWSDRAVWHRVTRCLWGHRSTLSLVFIEQRVHHPSHPVSLHYAKNLRKMSDNWSHFIVWHILVSLSSTICNVPTCLIHTWLHTAPAEVQHTS